MIWIRERMKNTDTDSEFHSGSCDKSLSSLVIHSLGIQFDYNRQSRAHEMASKSLFFQTSLLILFSQKSETPKIIYSYLLGSFLRLDQINGRAGIFTAI
jgi:hypothetical protein